LKILVCDDHPLIIEALRHVLRQLDENVTVVGARDCNETLEQAGSHSDLDLILLDLNLPGVGGFATLSQLRERHPDLPVVVVSVRDDRESVTDAMNRGAVGFIPKSSSNEVMVNALRLVLSGARYVPPEVFEQGDVRLHREGGAASSGDRPAPRTAADLGLSERQCQVLEMLTQGKSNKEICRELGLAEGTIKVHVSAILKALNVTSRTQAVVAVNRLGIRFH